MADFEDKFIGIDDSFYGDGTEETLAPLSTFKENLINERNLHLLEQNDAQEVPFRTRTNTDFAGNLRCDFNWRVHLFKPVYLQPETESLRFYIQGRPVLDQFTGEYLSEDFTEYNIALAASVWRRSPDGFVMEASTPNRVFDGGERVPLTASTTSLTPYTGSPDGQDNVQLVEVSLEGESYAPNTLRWVCIETRVGTLPTAASERIDGVFIDDYAFYSINPFQPRPEQINETNRGGGSPGIAGFHGNRLDMTRQEMRQCIYRWRFLDEDNRVQKEEWTQFIGRWSRGFNQGQTNLMTPFPYNPDEVTLTDRINVAAFACPMPQIDNVVIEPVNRKTFSTNNRFSSKPNISMQAQLPVRGAEVVDHVDLADHLMERWRPVYTGPYTAIQTGGLSGSMDDDDIAIEEGCYQRFSYINNEDEGSISLQIPAGVLFEEGEIEIQLSMLGIDFGMHPDIVDEVEFSDVSSLDMLKMPTEDESVSLDDDNNYVDWRANLAFIAQGAGLSGNTNGQLTIDLWRPSYSPARAVQMAWPMMCFGEIFRSRFPFLEKNTALNNNYFQLSFNSAADTRLHSGNNNTWWDDNTNTTGQHARLFNNPRIRIQYEDHDPKLPLELTLLINSADTVDDITPNQNKYDVRDSDGAPLIDLDRYMVFVRDVSVFVRGAK